MSQLLAVLYSVAKQGGLLTNDSVPGKMSAVTVWPERSRASMNQLKMIKWWSLPICECINLIFGMGNNHISAVKSERNDPQRLEDITIRKSGQRWSQPSSNESRQIKTYRRLTPDHLDLHQRPERKIPRYTIELQP